MVSIKLGCFWSLLAVSAVCLESREATRMVAKNGRNIARASSRSPEFFQHLQPTIPDTLRPSSSVSPRRMLSPSSSGNFLTGGSPEHKNNRVLRVRFVSDLDSLKRGNPDEAGNGTIDLDFPSMTRNMSSDSITSFNSLMSSIDSMVSLGSNSSYDEREYGTLINPNGTLPVRKERHNDTAKVWSSLLLAVENDDAAQVKKCMKKVDANQPANGGSTPLLLACQHGHPDVVKVLLKNPNIQLSINRAKADGSTPLLVATEKGFIRIVNLLLRNKRINVNAKNKQGYTPLIKACSAKRFDIIDALLAHKDIDADLKTVSSKSALDKAVETKTLPLVEHLIESKKFSRTNFQLAKNLATRLEQHEMVKLFKTYETKPGFRAIYGPSKK